ncbi:MAG: pyridoxamine 5'-phosphate oxidase family protein [Acidobacteriota bacterium]|nr:pyridoxamine 5'-phosphate oxidase family protein [Acidobacteriota bacterium]
MSDDGTPVYWGDLLGRLQRAHAYWLATATPTGGPHVAPIWGAVHGSSLHLFTERSTLKARNVARDPRVALHLADTDDVTIVYGSLVDLGHPRGQPEVLEALERKYDGPGEAAYLPSAPGSTYDVIYRLDAVRALTWSLEDFEGSQRRWRAGDG